MIVSSIVFILEAVISMLWMFPIVKERKSQIVFSLILLITLILINYFNIEILGLGIILVLLGIYFLFYAREYEYFILYNLQQLGVFIGIIIILSLNNQEGFLELLPILFFPTMYLIQVWLKARRSKGVFLGIIFFSGIFFYLGSIGYRVLMVFSSFIFIIFVESTYSGLSKNFVKSTKEFQNHVMLHHYEEVKSIYLNMRGWRHDYHNHIQSMKAILALEHYDKLGDYLGELEADLSQVDNLVKSGNLMVDAILNSKLSLAKRNDIKVTCKVIVPENIRISDIDICVILGNLLDNALEACKQIEKEKRFIRIYGDIVQSQFYFSVLNSAIEELNFNQRNYISEKRGEHGHGIRRVKLTVDKYEGYIKLRNEPGVFVSEVMISI
ncbi:MAG: GHKL domain-containing protein [Clostridium sp.]|nr:GHKL domain-containing protein [Clostridium sp.]MDU7085427.1 GHKL domain-containing protein [Clostridium sp.]